MKRKKKKPPTVNRQAQNIYHSQVRRAAKHGVTLTYRWNELVKLLEEAIGKRCTYCDVITPQSKVSIDHQQPIASAPTNPWVWSLQNLIACCSTCNRTKGRLNACEYRQLLQLIKRFHKDSQTDVLARLKKGHIG